MKYTRASNKLYHAIAALIELQSEYMSELEKVEAVEQISRALDLCNSVDTALIMAQNS